jgi:hypothetical protein
MSYSFDDLDGLNTDTKHNDKAIYEVGFDNDDDLLKWLIAEKNHLEKESRDRVQDSRKHIALYRGLQYFSQETRMSRRDREESTSKYKQKVVVNHLFDLTEQKVARIVKFKPNVAVMPVHDELEDRISAKVAKLAADHIGHAQKIDHKTQDAVRKALIIGEVYSFVEWNPDLGPEIEESKQARENDEELELIVDGKPVKDMFGKNKKLGKDEVVNMGDVEIKNVSGHNVFPEIKHNWSDVAYLMRFEIEETAKLKRRYKSLGDKIKQTKDKTYFDYNKYEESKLQRETIVWYFYHKATREVPKGRLVKFTEDVILENRELPYSHGEFPCERLVEIEVPEELHGRSSYIHARHLQAHINNLTSMQMRNQYMAAHPKWFVPYGSIKLETLGNDLTIVQYRGGQPPVLAQSNPTSPETIALREKLIEEMGQIQAVHGVSRGEPPAGVKAGVALQFLAEQENERQNAFTANYNEYVRKLNEKIILTASDYYEDDEERTLQVMGKDNKWMTKKLEAGHLKKNFDIRIQNSSALPKSQAARTQVIMDLSERYPAMFTEEQVLDMLDIGKTDRFFNEATAAVRSAEDIYEMITEGEEVPDPEEFEFHIPYWKVFASKMQDHAFRDLPEEIQTQIKDYMGAREMMMVDKGEKNQMFAQKLGTLEQFPLIFKPDMIEDPLDEIGGGEMMPPPEMGGEMMPPPEMAGGQPPQQAPQAQALGQPQLEANNPQMPNIEAGIGPLPQQ